MKRKSLKDSINEDFDLDIQAAFKKLREDTDTELNLFEYASEEADLEPMEDDIDLEAVFEKISHESCLDESDDYGEDSLPSLQPFFKQRAYLNPALYQAKA